MNRIYKIVLNVFFGALLVVATLMIIPILPISGNYQVKVVLSGSMEPTIKTGSIIFIHPTSSYETGDVITFMNGSFKDDNGRIVPVTHRIIEVKSGEFGAGFVTKGDANDSPDLTLTRKENIIGEVFLTIPYLGYAVETAKQPYGFLTLIIIPAVIIIGDQIKNIVTEVKKNKQKKISEVI